MRILVANPNTDDRLTARMVGLAEDVVGPGIEVAGATAATGAAAIETEAQIEAAAAALPAMFKASAAAIDAAVIACFVDPGLRSIRLRTRFPVLGMVEASLLSALTIAERVAIVTVSHGALPYLEELIGRYGLASRVGPLRAMGVSLRDIGHNPENWLAPLTIAVRDAAKEADAVVVGGAFLAGLGNAVEASVPVFDSFTATILQAAAIVRSTEPRGSSVAGAPWHSADPGRDGAHR